MPHPTSIRSTVAAALRGGIAHVDFEQAVAGLDPQRVNDTLPGLPYSIYGLVEHLHRAQRDILEFMTNPAYRERAWPADYWPTQPASPQDWLASVQGLRDDLAELGRLVEREDLDLNARVPNGKGQTNLREFLLVLDHNAYHLGEIVTLRRALGLWPGR